MAVHIEIVAHIVVLVNGPVAADLYAVAVRPIFGFLAEGDGILEAGPVVSMAQRAFRGVSGGPTAFRGIGGRFHLAILGAAVGGIGHVIMGADPDIAFRKEDALPRMPDSR